MEKFIPRVQLTTSYVNLINAWFSPSQLSTSFNNETYHLEITPPEQQNVIATLSYHYDESLLQLGLLEDNFLNFLDPQLASIKWADCDQDFQNCLLDAYHETLAEILKPLYTGTFSKADLRLAPQENFAAFATLSVVGTKKSSLLIMDDEPCISFFQKILQSHPHSQDLFNPNAIPFLFNIESGYAKITLNELHSIREGDIVLAQEQVWAKDKLVKFHTKGFAFWAKNVALNKFEIQTSLMDDTNDLPAGIIPEDDTPEISGDNGTDTAANEAAEETTDTPPSMVKVADVSQLPVLITFNAGQKAMTFDEIKNLHVGYTFETDHAVNDFVEIKANGKTIGMGEWVCINEHFGVRITQLNS